VTFDFESLPDRRGTGSMKWDRYAGRDVLPMWVADMDFRAPACVIDALAARVAHGVFGYTQPDEEVTSATLAWVRDRHGVDAQADWLLWFPGLVPALSVICRAFGSTGDEVLTLTPVYPPFLSSPGFSDRRSVTVPLSLEGDRWGIDLAQLEASMTPRTRVLIFCNPHNPVGRVFTEREVRDVAELCRVRGVVFCSDEIHADLVLGPMTPTAETGAGSGAAGHGMRHVSAAALGDGANTIVLMAPSKTFNTPGLSCAFVLIPDPAIRNAVRGAARGLITEVNAMGYVACAAAFREGEPWRRALLDVLRDNRDALYRFVAERMPRIRLRPMDATYLAWLDCRDLGVKDPAGLFESGGVGVSDGRLFGPGGEGFVRLNFGCPPSRLAEALRRMEAALGTLA